MLNLVSISLKLFLISIILNLQDESVAALSISRPKRSLGVKEWYYLWPEGRIPYVIDTSSFDGFARRLIKQAMREWERATCVKFMDSQNFRIHPDYVYFTKSDAECYTNGVGRSHAGRNHVYLGENCLTKRIILHELGHIIGLHDEHKRSDRDEYVTVNFDNIKSQKGIMNDFEKLSSEDAITFNQTYDYNSIMHYHTNAFASDPSKETITPLKAEGIQIIQIGRTGQLSEIDISGVNRLYNCSDCRKLLEGDHGTLNVTNDVNTLSSSIKHCEWRIIGSTHEQVIIHISNWSIPKTEGCRTNYLRVIDESKRDSLHANLCGEGGWEEVGWETSQLIITLHTNTFNSEYFGFNGNFRKDCGGQIELEEEGKEYYFESPGFPYEYTANKWCVWYLNAPYHKRIILKFDYFQLETSENCRNDYVEIRNGDAYYSPLIGRYCNSSSPEVIRSKGYALYVKFVSNKQIQEGGFSAIATLRKSYF